jgi:hypothetical protein
MTPMNQRKAIAANGTRLVLHRINVRRWASDWSDWRLSVDRARRSITVAVRSSRAKGMPVIARCAPASPEACGQHRRSGGHLAEAFARTCGGDDRRRRRSLSTASAESTGGRVLFARPWCRIANSEE